MSNTSIMSVSDMIDSAFADPDMNMVNFKMIQAILYILARQLRILGRQVEVDISSAMRALSKSRSVLSVTEVKVQASVPSEGKKETEKKGKRGKKGSEEKSGADGTGTKESSVSGKLSATALSDKTSVRKSKRADSREEPDSAPKPIASVTLSDLQEEKLLILKRVRPEDRDGARSRSESRQRPGHRLSMVTQEDFLDLKEDVIHLKNKFETFGTPTMPENAELLEELRKGASLTDAMAALQLSARLEAAEKALAKMIEIVTDIAQHPPQTTTSEIVHKRELSPKNVKKSKSVPHHAQLDEQGAQERDTTMGTHYVSETQSEKSSTKMSLPGAPPASEEHDQPRPIWITEDEFQDALVKLRDDLQRDMQYTVTKNTSNADSALRKVLLLETKLEEALQLGNRMAELENVVAVYAEHINAMDTGLSSQMTNYQELLTQMQHELETGLEVMAESLVSATGDPVAVAELNGKFTSLQLDFDNTSVVQSELKNTQTKFALDLKELWQKIEVITENKSDREEVADALKDKAGLGALNGLVTQEQFTAVRGDLEKRIRVAYDKFNSQEIVWQKAIDDLIRELNEKVDWLHVVELREDVNTKLKKLDDKIKFLFEIVGEPRAFAVSKKINRDNNCLSCSTPAQIDVNGPEGPLLLPALRPQTIGAEAGQDHLESGDHNICYPGFPVPHKIDPRAHFCNRYCGGSHTRITNAQIGKVPPDMILKSLEREITTAVGSDGRTYLVDCKVPCRSCNQTPNTPRAPESLDQTRDNIEETPRVTDTTFLTADLYNLTSYQMDNSLVTPSPLLDE